MFKLEFTRRFSMAHRLLNGGHVKCAVPHGHNEFVTVTLEAVEPGLLDGSANMVEPFARAKQRWHEWIDGHVDHAFQLSDGDPLLDYFREHEPEKLAHVLVTPGDPTTEALAVCFMAKINALLAEDGGRLRCVQVRIEETPTNTVVFDGDPETYLPRRNGPEKPWWMRPDMSISDLQNG